MRNGDHTTRMCGARAGFGATLRDLIACGVLLTICAGEATAKPALRDVPKIDNGLYTVGLANEIRRKCPDISGRIFKGISTLRALKAEATQLGYTDAEIEAHVSSDVEKDRLRARAKKYMKDQGFAQNRKGYCALGRAEIEKKTAVGALLRAN